MSINSVVQVGNLTRDCELKYSSTGFAICKFSIAVNERVKKGDQWEDKANYFDAVIFGKRGESLAQYLTKGQCVGISGKLDQNRWQDVDGNTKSKIVIIVNDLQLLGGNKSEVKQSNLTHEQVVKVMNTNDGYEDDIPF